MKKIYFLHPFLIALYPIFFLYEANKEEFEVTVLLTPSLLMVLFAAVALCSMVLVFRRAGKAAVVSSYVLFLTLSYSRIEAYVASFSLPLGFITLSSQQVFLVGLGLLSVSLMYKIYQAKPETVVLGNRSLAVVTAVLFAIPLTSIVLFEIETQRLWRVAQQEAVLGIQTTGQAPVNQPDIYYLIFDRYAGQRALQEQYSFDNSRFLDSLRDRGFYVAAESTANYPKTVLSLASSLNMIYLDQLSEQGKGRAGADQSLAAEALKNNQVIHFLRNRGYRYIHIGSWWSPTAADNNADVNYTFKYHDYSFADEFTTGFINTTIAGSLANEWFTNYLDVSKSPSHNLHRRSVLYQFDALKKTPSLLGPKFVFAHILAPHDPYVFNENCEPISEKETGGKKIQENYIIQLQCTNKQILEVVEHIVEQSDSEPIIILQSDEGPYPMNEFFPGHQPWMEAGDIALHEKFPILNAYYLPDVSAGELYPSITPVNSFRVIFNAYFNTSMPLLPDRNYIFQDLKHLYTFTDVTDRVQSK